MHVEVDEMKTNFGGHGLSGLRDFAFFSFAFKTAKISLQTMDYSPWASKNRIGQKCYASRGACTLISSVGMAIIIILLGALFRNGRP